MSRLVDIVLGRRLANREYGERKIGAFEGLPAMGLDALGSSSYGPEAALTVLLPLGAASVGAIGWVMAPIVALLLILFVSYWQTIRAYPNNGGAYIVARENLGRNASLLAAAALMIDYVLNVAVGISAGIAALVSAVPRLHAHMLPLCLLVLVILSIANLRGTMDAGRLFALPTYLFVASFGIIIAIGTWRAVHSGGHPQPLVAPPPLGPTTATLSVWLLLRAFASGCTAMTGVEAVSNGMTAFREPTVKYGHRTLGSMVAILAFLLAGVAYLSSSYHIGAMDQTKPSYQSVLSQLAHAAIGDGAFYYVAIVSVLAVLILSANTSFTDFPRLCHMAAQDGFLPKSFAIAGRRLVFSVGILYLTATAGVLLVLFDGITDRLIPLFAIGAFLTFTLSQSGMVVHWWRAARGRTAHLWINLIGAAATGVAFIVIVVTKFAEGAWITLLVIPLVIALLKSIRAYYDELERCVRDPLPLQLHDTRPPIVIVVTESWNKLADKALGFALSLSPDVVGVHFRRLAGPEAPDEEPELRRRWARDVQEPARAAGLEPPRLYIVQAPYRAMHEPLLKLVSEIRKQADGRHIAVLIPEVARQHWYQFLLHTLRPQRLRAQLLRYGPADLAVINVPWYLGETPAPPARRRAAHRARRADPVR
ncbi:MAG TPA: APC family permease [Steroidobacteraceae bacterium]|nr:APC family permease [Steroidobacteraceae bacterium]